MARRRGGTGGGVSIQKGGESWIPRFEEGQSGKMGPTHDEALELLGALRAATSTKWARCDAGEVCRLLGACLRLDELADGDVLSSSDNLLENAVSAMASACACICGEAKDSPGHADAMELWLKVLSDPPSIRDPFRSLQGIGRAPPSARC